MADTLTTKVRLNVRRGAPKTNAPVARTIDVGRSLTADKAVKGDKVRGNDGWNKLAGVEEYVWSGGVSVAPAGTGTIDVDPDIDRPDRSDLADRVPPRFVTAAGVRHKAQGRRSGGLEGAIVHFDAYRIKKAGNGAEDSDARSLDMMRQGQANGYHYAEISRTGSIFLPEDWDWDEWGYHAGKSKCPATGRAGVSQFYVGFEMNNPGIVYPTKDAEVFVPWFNAQKTANGAVILDAQGRATRRSENDEWYRKDEVRKASGGNIATGWYLPYSFAQFEALTNVMLWLADRYPSFRIDRIFGHDEVSPGRKTDPGGALADPDTVMTMAEFRAHLEARR